MGLVLLIGVLCHIQQMGVSGGVEEQPWDPVLAVEGAPEKVREDVVSLQQAKERALKGARSDDDVEDDIEDLAIVDEDELEE